MTAFDERRATPGPTTRPLPTVRATAADHDGNDGNDDYSATVLASHWIQRPAPEATSADARADATQPDRVDGTVLRFGPGVTAALAHRMNVTLSAVGPPAVRPGGRLRRYALPALVLIAAIAFVFWRQHAVAPVAVREITVSAIRPTVGCDGTADVVGVVRTNGGRGTLSYRWIRNDGTASAVLHTAVDPDRQDARVHLLWTFQGRGHYAATAELRVLSPAHRGARVHFTYDCP